MTQTLVLILIGTIPGYFVGRWRAEVGRARADARRAWAGRASYRNRS